MTTHSHYINGKWVEGSGERFESTDPASGRTLWSGQTATPDEINRAVVAARNAFETWSVTSMEHRADCLRAFRNRLLENIKPFAESLSRESGKPLWESGTEVTAMLSKVDLSIEAYQKRRRPETHHRSGGRTATRFKPHGVVAVLGPYNLPGHLSNAHVIPALLAGNTLVYKPSEQTPLVAQKLSELWESTELPPGAFNLVQGGRETGQRLADHPIIDGLFFTGGYPAGLDIHRKFADHPEKILALELGGNNPLAIYQVSDLDAAAYWTIQSAFITSGQRCTCARRLILPEGSDGNAVLDRFTTLTQTLRVGAYTSKPEPFMGPVISNASADRLLAAQDELLHQGGHGILPMRAIGGKRNMLSPGIIDVTGMNHRQDAELFGPLLQVIRVSDFDALVAEANNTAYGLSAGLLSDDADLFDTFYRKVRAGIINWNRPTTGASGALAFGGIGWSGNHRPSGFYASDYCSYPVASIEHDKLVFPDQITPGIEI